MREALSRIGWMTKIEQRCKSTWRRDTLISKRSVMLLFVRFFRICAFAIFLFQTGDNAASTRVAQQKATPRPARAIKVTVCTDHGKYSLNDDVRVNVLLENAGEETIYVDRRMFCCGIGTGLGLDVRDEQGKDVPLPHLQEELMPPPPSEDTSILVRLDAGFFYGRSYYLVARDFFPKPGRYSLRFLYRSRLPKEMVAPQLRDLPALWDDTPSIPSDPVWIEVTR
jgi:hypothetical protein